MLPELLTQGAFEMSSLFAFALVAIHLAVC